MERKYEDLSPASELIREDRVDTLVIYLPPGFRKEHLKAQRDDHGNLKVTGRDPKRWRRFQKHFRIPEGCDATSIRAKLDNNCLSISMPKISKTQEAEEQTDPDSEVSEGDESEDSSWRNVIMAVMMFVVAAMIGVGAYIVWRDR